MAGIPQVITEDRASGAQFIDGSLKFDESKGQYLKFTPSVSGNRRTQTLSVWIKNTYIGSSNKMILGAGDNASGPRHNIYYNPTKQFGVTQNPTGSQNDNAATVGVFRDYSGWQHLVVSLDCTVGANSGQVRIWVNGVPQDNAGYGGGNAAYISDQDGIFNTINKRMYLGHYAANPSDPAEFDGHMSQFYWIDGLAIGPGYFGYTDPLTGTWRPKKFRAEGTTVNDGTNWTSNFTGDYDSTHGWGTTYESANVFDGDLNSAAIGQVSATGLTWTAPGGGIGADAKTIRIFGNDDACPDDYLKINGINYGGLITQGFDPDWTVLKGPGAVGGGIEKLETVYLRDNSNGNTHYRWRALEIDGVILKDNTTQNLDFGTNGVYLPFDGNTPIGQDQSGKGNNWTPVNFGGSNSLEKATGAIPILNTNGGGTAARSGVRADKKTYTVTEVGGKYHLDGVQQPILNAYRGGTYTFDYTTPGASHPFYLSSLLDGKHNSKAYSVSFDGTDDYLSLASSSDFALGTNDWTVEYFAYCESTTAYQRHFYLIGSNANQIEGIYADSSGIAFGKTNVFGETAVPNPLNQWNHYALVHDSTSMRLYINGNQVISTTNNFADEDKSLHIGYSNSTFGGYFDGYISNFRVLKGTALYTSNFTPPQTTLTNITNTKLLCCQDSDATTAVVKPGTITTNGGAAATNSYSPFLYDNNHGNFGLNTGTSNTTKITIPHWAPDTLYYYCSAHSGMGSSINVTTDVLKADPYAWKCVLALPLLGSKDDVSASINVNGTTKTTAITGNAEPRSDRWDIYSGAFYFDSTADYIEVTPTSGTTLADNTAPYTIEFFFSMNNGRLTDNTYNIMWSTSSGLTIAKWRSGVSNKVYFESDGNATGWNITSQEDINSIRWYHFAAVRDGNTITTYLDGVRQGTATSTYSASAETWWRVGGQNQNSSCHAGYMQDFRIYNGVAKYTEDFSRASTTPDVLPDTPSGVSVKSKLAKITDGAVSISRSSNDYLQVPASTDFRLDGQYCIEYFLNLNDYSNDSVYVRTFVLDGPTGDGGSTNIHLNVNPSNGQLLLWSGSGQQISPNAYTNVDGGWHHVCVTRDSSNRTRLFIDGVLGNWSDINTDYNLNSGQNRPRLGALGSTGGTTGHYSNWRITKGSIPTEYQTSTSTNGTKVFDPPTEALTTTSQGATANDVKLIACQSITEPGRAAVSPSNSGINDGTNWSHYVTGDIDSNNLGYQAFDGNTSNVGCRTINAGGASIAWHPPSPIAFSSSFKIYCAKDGTTNATRFLVVHAGGTTDFSDSVVTSTTQTAVDLAQIAGVTSPISKIAIVSGGANPRFSAIEVDNTILVDPVSPIGGSAVTTFNPFTDDIDTTRGQESAYATFNPIQMHSSGAALSDGNLKVQTSSNVWKATQASIGMKTGKFYCEFGPNLWRDSNNHCQPGVRAINLTNLAEMGGANYSAFYHYTGTKFFNGPGGAGTSFGDAWNDSEYNIIGIAFDADTRKVWFSKNGVWQGRGNPSAGTNEAGIINLYGDGTYAFTLGTHGNSGLNRGGAHANFGQKPFKYAPPDGFQPVSLSTTQQEKVIARPDKYAGIAIYTGTGSAQTINLGFKPDLMWSKTRSHSVDHKLVDSVRGLTKVQESNNNRQDSTTTTGITATDSSGFSVGTSSDFNTSGRTYVTWGWRAGGSGSQPFYKDDVGYANASDVNMSVGSLNNDAYDQRETWSNGVTSSAGAWPGGFNTACGAVTNGFNGNTSNGVCATSAASIVWNNPQTTSTLSGKLEFYNRSDTTTYSRRIIIVHAGGTSGRITLTPNSSWQDLGTYTNITSIIITGDSPGGGVIDAIRVGGKILVDQGITPPNVPSIANIGASIGTKNGFSIIKYAGSGSNGTIAHGLSQAPDFFFGRDLEDTSNNRDWIVYHRDIGATGRAKFNSNAESVSSVFFQDTSPTDSVISVGTSNDVNSSNDYILYCWHDIPGLQKFGSYVNSSSSDSAFVELGFKPAILIYKCVRNISSSSGAGDWMIIDTTRSPVNNPSDMNNLSLNVSNGEDSYYTASQGAVDILSNGFKIRHNNSSPGGDPGRLYIYAAWAEAPAVNLYGGHANAR